MRITLTNDFHNSRRDVLSIDPNKANHITAYRVRSIKSSLCGIDGCTCSGAIGTRGNQRHEDKPIFIEINQDGSALIIIGD